MKNYYLLKNQLFRLRSFVNRGRCTLAQERAYETSWPEFGLTLDTGEINYQTVFGRKGPCFLEIGFGTGQSLLALARAHPHYNLIGVETHKPCLGALCIGIQQQQIKNIRIYYQDVIDVLEKGIPEASLDGIQIFFPDPWPKRRHHQRRLIQVKFIKLIINKLKPKGIFHLATDWEDYAKHMMKVITEESQLCNLAGYGQFSNRSPLRPVMTKFEKRASSTGSRIWDLQFERISL